MKGDHGEEGGKEAVRSRSNAKEYFPGLFYLIIMLMNGVVIIGMEMNLADFAAKSSSSLEKIGVALIFRSIGHAVGCILSGVLFTKLDEHYTMCCFIAMNSMVLVLIFRSNNVIYFYLAFTMLGVSCSVIQTGAILMVRRIYDKSCGFWLQCISLSFQIGVILLPSLQYIFCVETSYHLVASGGFIMVLFGVVSHPKNCNCNFHEGIKLRKERDATLNNIVWEDIATSCTGFFHSGIIVETMAYLGTYARIVFNISSPAAVVFWVAFFILIGQLCCLYFQKGANSKKVFCLFFGFSSLGCISMLMIFLLAPQNVRLFWFSICLFGFSWGPLLGLFLDLWNVRTLVPTAYGSAIVNFGAYAGSGIYSNIIFIFWIRYDYPDALLIGNVLGFSAALTFMCRPSEFFPNNFKTSNEAMSTNLLNVIPKS